MKCYQQKFSEVLSDSGALFFNQGLTLKDGRPTPYFINTGEFNSGKTSSDLGIAFSNMLITTGIIEETNIIFGPSYKGSSIVTSTALALLNRGRNVFYDYDRKEPKTHGEDSKKESLLVNKTLFDGAKIVILDDVWTSGATKYEAVDKINTEAKNLRYNVEIIGLGIAVDREQVGPVYDETKSKDLPNKERVILGERGEDAIKTFVNKTKIPVYSIVGISDAVNYLYKTKYPLMINGERKSMNAQTFEEFNKYMETYGVKND